MKKILALALALIAASAFGCTMSSAGIAHLKSYEQCSLTAYWDCNGWSIGWGHHKSSVKKGMRISQKQADKFLRADIKEAEKYADLLIDRLPYDYEFSRGFYDGLVDMIYNAGVGNVQHSSFYSRLKRCRVSKGKINKSDLEYTITAVKSFSISSKGHKSRRLATYNMMKNF